MFVSNFLYYSIQVVGNMGDAMEAANPAIKTTLLKCMRQPATTLSVQLAAIQAYRRMSVTDEVTNILLYGKTVSQFESDEFLKIYDKPVTLLFFYPGSF